MVRESDIEKYLIKRVKETGGEIRKVQWIGHNSAPDRRVMFKPAKWRGRSCVWVELKAPGEKPTAAQKREHKRMRDQWEEVYVIDSFKKVDRLMEEGYV